MKVSIVNGDAAVVIETDGAYNPDWLDDMCNRAVKLYRDALDEFDDEDAEIEEL